MQLIPNVTVHAIWIIWSTCSWRVTWSRRLIRTFFCTGCLNLRSPHFRGQCLDLREYTTINNNEDFHVNIYFYAIYIQQLRRSNDNFTSLINNSNIVLHFKVKFRLHNATEIYVIKKCKFYFLRSDLSKNHIILNISFDACTFNRTD